MATTRATMSMSHNKLSRKFLFRVVALVFVLLFTVELFHHWSYVRSTGSSYYSSYSGRRHQAVSRELKKGKKIHLDTCHTIFTSTLINASTPSNTVVIFTGRWHFLRIQLPHIIRELRQNGGIIDRVWFIMIRWEEADYVKLKTFAITANSIFKEEVFVFHDYREIFDIKIKKPYTYAYCQIYANLLKYPENRYFKLDDDVVFIQQGAFNKMIENKKKFQSKCLLNMFNIAGGNWVCNRMYQSNGVLRDLYNPHKVDFFNVEDEGTFESAIFSLRLFLSFQSSNELENLYLESMFWNSRYTINGVMFDADTFDIELIRKAGALRHDNDEQWWTVTYPSHSTNRSNCIAGDALIVHFSHSGPEKRLASKLKELGFLDEFEQVVVQQKEDKSIKMKDSLWRILEY